jgi:energy-coupling factor transport system substrate-specific component
MKNTEKNSLYVLLALIPAGIMLNVSLGTFVNVLKLPVYLDAVGTIVVTLLAGWRAGVIVGAASFILMSIMVNPVYIYFIGTQAVIALYVHTVSNHWHLLRNTFTTILVGIGLGVIAAIVSAPVIVTVFGGVSGSGRDLITALLMNSGTQIFKAVALSGAASEPIDKTLQLLLACLLLRSAPNALLNRFPSKAIANNIFLSNHR